MQESNKLTLPEGVNVDFGVVDMSGIHLARLDMDAIHDETVDPIYIDEFDITNAEGMMELNKYLYTTYETGSLSGVPMCGCIKDPITGVQNIGIVCDRCGQEVRSGFETDIDNRIWIRANDRMGKFIVPRVMDMLNNRFSPKGVSILRWFADPRYRIPTEYARTRRMVNAILEELQIERGWLSFVDNLIPIIDALLQRRMGKSMSLTARREMVEHLYRHQDKLFCKYLPLPSNLVLVKEETNLGSYGTTSITGVIDGARTIAELYTYGDVFEGDSYDSAIWSAMQSIASGYAKYDKEELFKKDGIIRSSMISGRMDMSARIVITSITRPHDNREIELSWAAAITVFEKLLIKYFKDDKRWGVSKTKMFLRRHLYTYCRTIDVAFDEILKQMPYIPETELRGIPMIIHRNPGLKNGSQQTVYVTHIKKDPKDVTVSLSGLILSSPNADFDGDAMNIWFIPDLETLERFDVFSPYRNLPDLNSPMSLSETASQEQEITMNIYGFIDHHDKLYGISHLEK